jgi:ribosome-associated protein
MNKKLEIIKNAIEEKKGDKIIVLDIAKKSSISDYYVICTGRSDKNIQAIADEIKDKMRESGEDYLGFEGYRSAKWVLMDYDDVIVHIFNEETRDFYKLEEIWGEY